MSSPQCTLLASLMKWTLPLSASHRWMGALLDRTLMGRKCPLSMYRSQKSLQLLPKVSLQQMLRLKLLHQPNLQLTHNLSQRKQRQLLQETTELHQLRRLPSPKPKKLTMSLLTTEAKEYRAYSSATQIVGHINGRLL